MKKFITLFVILTCTTWVAWGQGTIRGTVYLNVPNSEGEIVKEPLMYATVYIVYGGEKIYAQTNNHGDYVFRPVQSGTYNVTILSSQTDTIVVTGISVSGSSTSFVPDVISNGKMLDPIVIGTDRPLKQESPSKSELKRTELEKLPDPNINQILGLLGSTYVSDDGRQVSFRGARIGDALYIIDGVKQRGTNVSLPNGAIASLSAWHGGVPAEYGDFMGGVVVIETMSYFDWENQQEVKRLIAERLARQEQLRKELEAKEAGSKVPEPSIPEE